jgi:amino acid permease
LGGAPATQPYVKASQIFSVMYFIYFLAILAFLPYVEKYLLKFFDFIAGTKQSNQDLKQQKKKRKKTFRPNYIPKPRKLKVVK